MGFESEFKINLHHEHFPDALEKYTMSLLSFSVLVMYVYVLKFAAAFYGV